MPAPRILAALPDTGVACRERLRQFPSLVNCCTIDWYTSWPRDALEAVAQKFLASVSQPSTGSGADGEATEDAAAAAAAAQLTTDLTEMCKTFHEDVRELSESFRRTQGRVNYVTPTSFLELLTMFTALLDKQRGLVTTQQRRYIVRCSPRLKICRATQALCCVA